MKPSVNNPIKIMTCSISLGWMKSIELIKEKHLLQIESTTSVNFFNRFQHFFPDVILISSSIQGREIEQLVNQIRDYDGMERHTGILLAVDGVVPDVCLALESGFDDVVRQETSLGELWARIKTLTMIKRKSDYLRALNYKLSQQTKKDDLTGLYNMMGFTEQLTALNRNRGEKGIGLIMFDLDFFKSVNDTTNHLMGSYCLKEIGNIVANLGLKTPHAAARYGGDEFVFCLLCDEKSEVLAVCEKIRTLIQKTIFHYDNFSIRITSSLGAVFAERHYRISDRDLIKLADEMLYHSKANGRNQSSIKSLNS